MHPMSGVQLFQHNPGEHALHYRKAVLIDIPVGFACQSNARHGLRTGNALAPFSLYRHYLAALPSTSANAIWEVRQLS